MADTQDAKKAAEVPKKDDRDKNQDKSDGMMPGKKDPKEEELVLPFHLSYCFRVKKTNN